jgi:hypothetical protein
VTTLKAHDPEGGEPAGDDDGAVDDAGKPSMAVTSQVDVASRSERQTEYDPMTRIP